MSKRREVVLGEIAEFQEGYVNPHNRNPNISMAR